MAQVYSAPPAGGLFNIPETLPQGLLYRYKKISNLSRQNLKVPPNNGQSDCLCQQTTHKARKELYSIFSGNAGNCVGNGPL